MKKVLVTGAAGFIGSHLTTRLVELGHSVIALDNLCTGNVKNLEHVKDHFRFVLGDVADKELLAELLEEVEVVYHHAAIASVPRSINFPLESHHACATSTVTLLDACRNAGVRRLVYAGSSSAYGNNENPNICESELPEVHSPYAAAKLAGELYCQSFAACYDLEVVRLRYFNIFGPRQDPNSPYSAVIPIFVSLLLKGERPTIFGDGSQTRDFTFVDNVVQANLLAGKVAGVSGRVFNVATGTSLSVLEMLEQICRLLDLPCDPIFAKPRLGDVVHSGADITAIQNGLGFSETVSFDEGLELTVAYYKERFLSQHSSSADDQLKKSQAFLNSILSN